MRYQRPKSEGGEILCVIGLSIKIIMFLVKRPGDYKRADWGLFFSFLQISVFFHIIFYYFSP